MHEYFRNLYPDDPYIAFDESVRGTDRVYETTYNLLNLLEQMELFKSYPMQWDSRQAADDVQTMTGKVYGKLWKKFTLEQLTESACNIVKERFEKNAFDYATLKGKKTIDVGCGSGRFSIALRMLGCEPVVGVDYGDDGLQIAKNSSQALGLNDIRFRKENILGLRFEDESFDFSFCNGVLHHSKDLRKGIHELVRVTRKGGQIWLYLYGNGGIFWYARKQMPLIMKKIPQEYTQRVLDTIGIPSDRFIFTDNWYVPIETMSYDHEIREILETFGVQSITRLEHGRSTDLEHHSIFGGVEGKTLYGDGELRYIITN